MEGKAYAILAIVLLASLIIALIFIYPLLTGSPNQRQISFDWSGYYVASGLNNPQPQVTSINASWTVPSINVSQGDTFSAAWIGIGGQSDETLIQTGTEHDSISGQAMYSVWYELLPTGEVAIQSISISSGDRITASISLLNSDSNTWLIETSDVTSGQAFQTSLVYVSLMLSAEWIVERPTVNNRLGTLADFDQMAFTDCTAIMGGTTGTISNFPFNQIVMYNRRNTELVNVSPLTSNGASFTVKYLN